MTSPVHVRRLGSWVRSQSSAVRLRIVLFVICCLLICDLPAVAALDTVISFYPLDSAVSVGTVFDVDITLAGVADLGSVQLQISFDPTVLSVVDANPGTPLVIEIQPGDIFVSDSPLFNQADNVGGQIDYSIMNTSSGPFTGDGVIATITFLALGGDVSPLDFDLAILAEPGGADIPATMEPGSVTVSGEATETPTPTVTETATPTATDTATPDATLPSTPTKTTGATITPPTPTNTVILTPTSTHTPAYTQLPLVFKSYVVELPTPTPTATYTASPTPTATDLPTIGPSPPATPTATATETSAPTSTVTATSTQTLSPTLTGTVTPTATWAPGKCIELVVNGDCEDYEADDAWDFIPSAHMAGYSSTQCRDTRALRTGIESGGPVFSYSAVEQVIDVPLEAEEMTLTFWYYCVATGPDYDGDRHYAFIIDQEGIYHTPYLLDMTWPESNQQSWVQAQFTNETYDLGQFRGQRIRLHFETVNNPWGGFAVMYIDDVSLEVCR